MAIKINGQDLLKRFINGQEIVRVYKNGGQIRPETVPPVFNDYLCFTAQQNNSTVTLNKDGYATIVYLEISYDKNHWEDYTFGTTISLNQGESIYWRNKSETPTEFTTPTSKHKFSMTGEINASGDLTSLLCKYGTHTLSGRFDDLFFNCQSLKTCPKLVATTLIPYCYYGLFAFSGVTEPPVLPALEVPFQGYYGMFVGCPLEALPKLPATSIRGLGYVEMFRGCSSIKISETQTGEYQTPYRIPQSGTGTVEGNEETRQMFGNTGGTFTGTPNINQTYYTSNQVI